MDKNAPYIRMAGLLVIAYIFFYTSDLEFNEQYTSNPKYDAAGQLAHAMERLNK